jgi:hypothetical protein
MTLRASTVRRLLGLPLALALVGSVAACGGGSTGGYPPPPPPYKPPPAAVAKASEPKFQPLVKSLLVMRRAAKGDLSGLARKTDDQGKPLSNFAASRAASDALTKALAEAELTPEERTAWTAISALDDAELEKLVKK